jgi:hypothetical protein
LIVDRDTLRKWSAEGIETLQINRATVVAKRLGIFTPSPDAVRRKRAEQARAAGVFPVALLGRTRRCTR